MLYTHASAEWRPGRPLTPIRARSGFFRTRVEAGRAAEGRPILAVTLRFDPTRGLVVAEGPVARELAEGWAAQAIIDTAGCVMVFAPIPASLVRVIGPAEIRIHPGLPRDRPRPRIVLFSIAHDPNSQQSWLAKQADSDRVDPPRPILQAVRRWFAGERPRSGTPRR